MQNSHRRIITVALTLTATAALAAPPRPATMSKDLLKGASWRYSTDGGKTFPPKALSPPKGKTVRLVAKAEFVLAGPTLFDATREPTFELLQLTASLGPGWTATLNGKTVAPPLKGMNYRTIPGISAKLLRRGENVLLLAGPATGTGKPLGPPASLTPQYPDNLTFQSGPVLGACSDTFFSLTCRTNLPADVELTLTTESGKTVRRSSKGKFIHRFALDALDARWSSYALTARRGQFQIRFGARTGPRPTHPPNALRFIATGDSRSHPDDWAKVAKAVHAQGPEFVLFNGDLVTAGCNNWEWDAEFFGPAKALLATIPLYPVIGNHEQDAPIYDEMFYTPTKDGRGRNWTQTVRYVQIIGIEGDADWSKGSANVKWLARTLAASKAKFIFLCSHYPAWTSSSHGKLDSKGRPKEKPIREAQDVILPLLTKHKVTAMLAGHDHCYERSDPPGGVTHIICGGAGAPLRPKSKDAKRQNPHSKVYAASLHYCMFDLNGEVCTMRVLTPDGKQIDEHTWEYRGAPPREPQATPAQP